MTVVSPIDALRSVEAHKQIGWPNGYGQAVYGFSHYGEDNPFYGIYQVRRRSGYSVIVKEKFYRPPVQRTPAQAIQRDKMVAAVSAWQALSEEEKQAWRTQANRRSKRGVDIYISNFLDAY